MGKRHRHQKHQKSEKSKVKLKKKGSKYLSKGANITDTSFKVRQIVIQEQLKAKDSSEPLSRRKLSVKELLVRLQHYNAAVRLEGMAGLKELIVSHSEDVLSSHLGEVVSGVPRLVLDKEKSVRREALKLLAVILEPIAVEQVIPFFDTLSSYLLCAMTHIDVGVREDSLMLLDSLLACVPSLVASNANKILSSFFDLISKLKNDSKPDRMLTVNLGRRVTTVKWRVKVLVRLKGILSAVLDDKKKNQIEGSSINVYKFDTEKSNYFPIYRSDYNGVCTFKLNNSKSQGTNESTGIDKYVDSLMPLLFDTWLEVRPVSRGENDSNSEISDDAVVVLACILKILDTISSLISTEEAKEWGNSFKMKYSKDYSLYIMNNFPYTKAGSTGMTCEDENLLACRLFCIFNKRLRSVDDVEYANKVVAYVRSCLLPCKPIRSSYLVPVLNDLLLEVSKSWTKKKVDFLRLLKSTLKTYEHSKDGGKVFDILCRIVNVQHLNSCPAYQLWLSKLAELLCRNETPEIVINTVLLLAKQRNALVVKALGEKVPDILANLMTRGVGRNDVDFRIVDILYYVPFDVKDRRVKEVSESANGAFGDYFANMLKLKANL